MTQHLLGLNADRSRRSRLHRDAPVQSVYHHSAGPRWIAERNLDAVLRAHKNREHSGDNEH